MFQVKIQGFNNHKLFLLKALKVIGFKQNNLNQKAILLGIFVAITAQRIGCQHFQRKTTSKDVKIVKDFSMPHIYGRTNMIKNKIDKKRLYKTNTNHIWAICVRLVKKDIVKRKISSSDLFKLDNLILFLYFFDVSNFYFFKNATKILFDKIRDNKIYRYHEWMNV